MILYERFCVQPAETLYNVRNVVKLSTSADDSRAEVDNFLELTHLGVVARAINTEAVPDHREHERLDELGHEVSGHHVAYM